MSKESDFLAAKGWREYGTIGEGGQAKVKLVRRIESNDGNSYALKILKSDAKRQQAVARFQSEIVSIRKVDHPNIVKVIDSATDESGNIHFYVMEYVEGAKPLKKFVGNPDSQFAGNPLRSLEIYVQILEALKACENAQIVHRDLNLGNVLITPDHKALLIDFGCCLSREHGEVTLVDEAVGTINYRAPECEAFRSASPTIRADLYSAGKILWSLVTNRQAFTREEDVFNDLALAKLLPENSMAWHLHHVFEKTIRKSPDHRYRNVAEAIDGAKQVKKLIECRVDPLETLAKEKCPICALGVRYYARVFHENTLIDYAMQKRGVKDEEIVKSMENEGFPSDRALQTCTYCGFCFYRNMAVVKRNLDYRKGLS